MNKNSISITECPRDAMQGLHDFIPTELKIKYLNALLKVGFNVLDFGSFVSPKAIPQLADTATVLEGLELDGSNSELLAIIANQRGAESACNYAQIQYLGFPFSVSETFQQRNTNASQEQAIERISDIQEMAIKSGKEMVVYLSMAFGNPYGDEWSIDSIAPFVEQFSNMGIKRISLADTVGIASPEDITTITTPLVAEHPDITILGHLHTTPTNWKEKLDALISSGCNHIDTAIAGFGGCPMATDKLTGNLATENLLLLMEEKSIQHSLNLQAFSEAQEIAREVFPN